MTINLLEFPPPAPPVVERESTIGVRIKAAREARGLSQADLANATNRSGALVCQWEQGKSTIMVGDLVAVADITEVSLTWLATGRASLAKPNVSSLEQIMLKLNHIEMAIAKIARDRDA